MNCPHCKKEMPDDPNICSECGFDLALFRETYEDIYSRKLEELDRLDQKGQF